jgi:hypothetical protein
LHRLSLLLFGLGIVLVVDLRGVLLYNRAARVAVIREKSSHHYIDVPGETEMTVETITLQVDTDLAQAYQSAPAKEKTKLRLLLNLWLRELFVRSTPLTTLMDDLSDKAEARGLTAEKLEDMLRAH